MQRIGYKDPRSFFRSIIAKVQINDLSKYLKTERLEDACATLAGDNVSVLVDLVTVRIAALFAHGSFGTLQQLVYHPNVREHKPGTPWGGPPLPGRWSISPFFRIDGKIRSPLGHFGGPETYHLDPATRTLNLQRIPCVPGTDCLDWQIRLDGHTLAMKLGAPRQAEQTGVELNLYPLYTDVYVDGRRHVLSYDRSSTPVPIKCGESLTLVDEQMRLPRMRVEVKKGSLEVKPYTLAVGGYYLAKDDPAKVYPHGLCVRAVQTGCRAEVRVTLLPNPSTISHEPLTMTSRQDLREPTIRMGETLLGIQEKTGQCLPPLKGLIATSYYLKTLKPYDNGAYAVCIYMPRTTMSLAAATLASGDRKYIDGGYRSLKAYLDRCPHISKRDGGIFVVGAFLKDGSIKDAKHDANEELTGCYYNRPSNFAIMLRALLYCHDVFAHLGDTEKANEALELGVEVVKGLKSVYGIKPKYVNNPHYSVARFLLRLEARQHPGAAFVRAYLEEELQQRGYDRQPLPPLHKVVSGAGESSPNVEQDYASVASEYMAKWLLTQRKDCAKTVCDLNRSMTWLQNFFVDKPSAFGASIVEPLEQYNGGYRRVMYHGGMWDLVRMEMLLAAAEYLDDPFSRDAARAIAMGRLAWSFREDGTLYGAVQIAPGVQYHNEDFAETLNYGSLGLYAYWHFARVREIRY